MHELNWGKRPIEEHDNARLPENTKRRRGDDSASSGFGSGEAGRYHLRFSGTATIHFDFNINTESLSKESAQQQHETQQDKAHDQASSRKPCRGIRLFGVNIADGLGRQQQEASSSRQAELGLEQRLGRQQGQESTILAQQTEVSQASSSRQQLGWQGQEAFHPAQPHQETRPLSQQEVINEQMPLEIPSDSDSESNHVRPLSFREINHEKIHHQAGLSNLVMHGPPILLDQILWHQITQAQRNIQLERTGDESRYRQTQGDSASLASRPDRSLGVLQMFAQAVRNQGHRQRLPEYLLQEKKLRPFNDSEYKKICQIYKYLGIKEPELGNLRRKIYNMTERGKAAVKKYQESSKDQAKKKEIDVKGSLEAKDSKATIGTSTADGSRP